MTENDVFGDIDAKPDKTDETPENVVTCSMCEQEVYENGTDIYGICTMCRKGR
jgi:hypothetical protein